jgi:hypothetical protein
VTSSAPPRRSRYPLLLASMSLVAILLPLASPLALPFTSQAPRLASAARAQQVPGRTLGVRWRDGVPYLHFSARDLANADVRRKLDSGLPQTIVMRVYAYRSSDPSTPIAVAPQSCRVTNEIMEDRYRVQVQTARGDATEWIGTLDAVVRRCLEVRGIQVGQRSGWIARRGERVYFAVLIEFNPLSPDTVRRIRRWLANSGGGPVQNDAFFGSFVSLFVNRRIGSAERALSFQSQPVRVP